MGCYSGVGGKGGSEGEGRGKGVCVCMRAGRSQASARSRSVCPGTSAAVHPQRYWGAQQYPGTQASGRTATQQVQQAQQAAETERARRARRARATRGRRVPIACGRSAENTLARSRRRTTSNKRGRGTRRVERRWQRRVRLSDERSGGERLKQRWGGAKMDGALALNAVVLEELRIGRNSEKLANALSLLTSLE